MYCIKYHGWVIERLRTLADAEKAAAKIISNNVADAMGYTIEKVNS